MSDFGPFEQDDILDNNQPPMSDEDYAKLAAWTHEYVAGIADGSDQNLVEQSSSPARYDFPAASHFSLSPNVYSSATQDDRSPYTESASATNNLFITPTHGGEYTLCAGCSAGRDEPHASWCGQSGLFGGNDANIWEDNDIGQMFTPLDTSIFPTPESLSDLATLSQPNSAFLPETPCKAQGQDSKLKQKSKNQELKGCPGRKTVATELRERRSYGESSSRPNVLASAGAPVFDRSSAYPHATRAFPGGSGSADPPLPIFRGLFTSFDEAREAVKPPPEAEDLVHQNIPNDNLDFVRQRHIFKDYCTRLFAALYADPIDPPDRYHPYEKAYFREHQEKQQSLVKSSVESDPIICEARVMLLMEEILNIHSVGVPRVVADRRTHRAGYILEQHPCSTRMERVITAVQNDKYVAQDVIAGTGMADLARSPERYLHKKQESCRGNGLKRHQAKNGPVSERRNRASVHEAEAGPSTLPTPTSTQRRSRGGQQ